MLKSLGFLETKGNVGNIEALDAMLKAAEVELVGSVFIGAGLISVVITGEVAAVKAATEAGAVAAKKVGELYNVNVIPRPHKDLELIMPSKVCEQGNKKVAATAERKPLQALGMIETYGINANWQAADAMLKAADVEMVGQTQIGAGLVTIYVQGDVGAVEAAVDAGAAAASGMGEVVSKRVIARPHEGVNECMPVLPK